MHLVENFNFPTMTNSQDNVFFLTLTIVHIEDALIPSILSPETKDDRNDDDDNDDDSDTYSDVQSDVAILFGSTCCCNIRNNRKKC